MRSWKTTEKWQEWQILSQPYNKIFIKTFPANTFCIPSRLKKKIETNREANRKRKKITPFRHNLPSTTLWSVKGGVW